MGVIVLVLRDGSICHPLQSPPPPPSPLHVRPKSKRIVNPWSQQAETRARSRVDNATIRHITVKGSELDAGSVINLRAVRVSSEFDSRAINYKVR